MFIPQRLWPSPQLRLTLNKPRTTPAFWLPCQWLCQTKARRHGANETWGKSVKGGFWERVHHSFKRDTWDKMTFHMLDATSRCKVWNYGGILWPWGEWLPRTKPTSQGCQEQRDGRNLCSWWGHGTTELANNGRTTLSWDFLLRSKVNFLIAEAIWASLFLIDESLLIDRTKAQKPKPGKKASYDLSVASKVDKVIYSLRMLIILPFSSLQLPIRDTTKEPWEV